MGASADSIESMVLHILQNGERKVAVPLADNIRTQALREDFGADGILKPTPYGSSPVNWCKGLFAGGRDIFGPIDTAISTRVTFEVEVKTRLGQSVVVDGGRSLKILKRFDVKTLPQVAGRNYRFEAPLNINKDPRDQSQGGDDWAAPHVLELLNTMVLLRSDFQINDISNLHGGSFPPHIVHGDGLSVDGLVAGFPNSAQIAAGASPGADAANNLIDLFSQMVDEDLAKIDRVLVTFSRDEADPFRQALMAAGQRGVRFAGRTPRSFFSTDIDRKKPVHKNHFHIWFKQEQ